MEVNSGPVDARQSVSMTVIVFVLAGFFGTPEVRCQTTESSVPADISLNEVFDGFRARTERFRSGRFSWTEDFWIKKGGFSNDPEVGTKPGEDATVERRRTVVFDENYVRFESEGDFWNDKIQDFKHRTGFGVWVTDHSRPFMQYKQFDGEKPYGDIYERNWSMRHEAAFRPFFYAFRMLEPEWGRFDMHDYRLAPLKESVGGHLCVVVETSPLVLAELQSKGRAAVRRRWWVNPKQEFAVVRHEVGVVDEVPMEEAELTYVKHEEYGWYPSSWRFSMNRKSGPVQILNAEVVEFSLNQTVDRAEFELEFPVGTWVQDFRKHSEDGFREFLVRADDEREIRRGEAHLSRDKLMASEPGEAIKPRSASWLLLGVNLLVVCGVLVLLLLKRMQRT